MILVALENWTKVSKMGLMVANVEVLMALGRQSGVSVWQHTLVG